MESGSQQQVPRLDFSTVEVVVSQGAVQRILFMICWIGNVGDRNDDDVGVPRFAWRNGLWDDDVRLCFSLFMSWTA